MEQEQLQQLQLQYIALYVLATISISFWVIIWIMHLCALTNAKMKFSKKSYLFAANKRETKQSLCFHHNYHSFPQNSEQQHRQQLKFTTAQLRGEVDEVWRNCDKQQQLFSNDNNVHLDGKLIKNGDDRCDSVNVGHCFNLNCKHFSEDKSSVNNNKLRHQPPTDHHFLSPSDTTTITSNNTQSSQHIDLNNNTTKSLHKGQHFTSYYFYINLPLPGVSIIKPLVGVDANLFFNLETFFHLDYPTYEILFCVQEQQDPAVIIVEQLFKKYPQTDARLFIGGSRVGVNPKINNMQPAYESMKYELFLISDSGIQMQPDTLTDMVGHMSDDVALVHQMPFVNFHERNSFQAIVERVYFGTVHARAYLTADLLNINCPTGMSALMRKSLLDEAGGIKAFGQYLAEDFFFAKSFTERGWKICISSQPAMQNSANSSDSLSTLNTRIQRWIKLRFAMVPQWTLIEPFSECMLIGLLGATSISFMWAINPFLVFALHVLTWFMLDYKLICTIQNEPLTCSKTKFLAAWLTRECTALVVFVKALADPKVTWRSREFKLKWGGFTEEVPSEAQAREEKAKICPAVLTQRAAAVVADFVVGDRHHNQISDQQHKLPRCIMCQA